MKVERWQAERINKELFHCVNYLGRLQGQLVRKAYDAVFDLGVELHYLSCKGGVGRPADGDPG